MPVRIHQSGKKNGTVLFLVLIIISTLSVLGGILSIQVENRFLISELESDRLKALCLAEAAVAKVMHEMKTMKDTDNNGIGNINKISFGGGFIKAEHLADTNEISATGIFNGVKRTLLLKYAIN